MKKLNLILEAVLLVAVIVLYALYFCDKRSCKKDVSATEIADLNPALPETQIVYVNVDSLMQNYFMFQDLRNELTEKSQKIEAELSNKFKKHQADVTDFENKAQKGLETRAKLAEIQQQLMADQQKLAQLRDNYSMQLGEEEQVMNRKLLTSIMDYLKEYNQEKGYQYILGNSFGSNLLYVNQTLDITSSVLAGINAKYRAEHPAVVTKK